MNQNPQLDEPKPAARRTKTRSSRNQNPQLEEPKPQARRKLRGDVGWHAGGVAGVVAGFVPGLLASSLAGLLAGGLGDVGMAREKQVDDVEGRLEEFGVGE